MKSSYLFILILILLIGCKEATTEQIDKPESSQSWAMLNFVKADSLNPILKPGSSLNFDCPVSKKVVNWEEKNVLNPSAIIKDGKVYMVYRAQDSAMCSRLGLAISDDGLNFVKQDLPILYPDNDEMQKYEWPGGIEDPRLVESEDGTYILTYTAYDGKTARLCLASSRDLLNWTKHGLVLADEKYKDTWSKAGAIVARQEANRMVATKINGKYWMYFGDTNLFMATSDDLIHWQAAENEENGQLISVLHPRKGYFDSRLVEPGPYAMVEDQGILLIYNASNAANYNLPELPKFTYAAGQALFDKEQPFKLIDRTDEYFIHPDKDYEKIGEVNEVCFVEGLVFLKNKWFLYYGTADSKIAVAVKN